MTFEKRKKKSNFYNSPYKYTAIEAELKKSQSKVDSMLSLLTGKRI